VTDGHPGSADGVGFAGSADGVGFAGSAEGVGFVGAGRLGGPMVERLVGAGHPVRVFARRPEAARDWRAHGVPTAESLADLGSAADTVIVCVYDEDQLRQVVLGGDGLDGDGLAGSLAPGSVLVSHTTSGIGVTDEIAAALAERGVDFVDAPFSGTADHIRRGELTVLLGGTGEALDRVDPVLAAYCAQRVRTGAAGSATRVKLVNNLLFAANVQLAGLAVEVAGALDVDERTLIESISHCSADSAALGYVRQFGSVRALATQVGEYLRKDVAAVRESARAAGVDLGMLGTIATTGPLEALHP
jgi:3-hydroxyisobutyrate dehydrogenase-like beta-hydroxyacid dehydrogenase